jgi:hypothetical protein
MIYLRSLLAAILALFLSLYGISLVVALWMRLSGKPNTYFVVLHLRSPLVWLFSFAVFGAAFLFQVRRGSSKAKR